MHFSYIHDGLFRIAIIFEHQTPPSCDLLGPSVRVWLKSTIITIQIVNRLYKITVISFKFVSIAVREENYKFLLRHA